ncbi:MAG: NAD(+) diphosphatase [Chloroflexi bacterium]|nr:NAD(+) diphosphatase [Ardenticatenaceae bacterium]MBL1128840.1 NAD(+) diphosphatase [Chloroflexota bacterium]NOG34917.1 NAD(+) diphosphatase [Chloroflexota bacterium]GIK58080.1 MAG: NADH pyrophosphatase [Chloroflexota bacterium]
MELFVSLVTPPEEPPATARWFILSGFQLLVVVDGRQATWPLLASPADLGLTPLRQHYLGYMPGDAPLHCYAVEVAAETLPPPDMAFEGLRALYGRMPDEQLWLGGRALQILDWDRTSLYCGRCGVFNAVQPHERAKKCPACGLVTYPRISPAVIMRVTRQGPTGREILLARGARHPAGFYSVLAGFVEPGETLETAVRREIREEVGLEVQNVTYFGSQPWPFPNSLMIAYTAEYASGDITPEAGEIEDARWFTADNLPGIPPAMSISRRLIDDFVQTTR